MIKLLLALIKPFEGLHKRLKNGLIGPYICPAGYATQGYGLLVPGLHVPAIAEDEAERRLAAAIPAYVRQALQLCPGLAHQPPERLAAVADFVFNLGAAKFSSSTLRRKINEGDWEAACYEFGRWVNGGGRRLPGPVLRRAAEVAYVRRTL